MKTVFITGASSGIGRETALFFQEKGWNVIATMRNPQKETLLQTLPHVKEVRNQGLLVGVEFDDTISGVDVKHGALDRKLLITAIGAHIIRMVPPLIVSEEECDKAFDILNETVKALS